MQGVQRDIGRCGACRQLLQLDVETGVMHLTPQSQLYPFYGLYATPGGKTQSALTVS